MEADLNLSEKKTLITKNPNAQNNNSVVLLSPSWLFKESFKVCTSDLQ